MMNGKLVAVNDEGEEVPVKVSHWWPHRTWAGKPTVPLAFRRVATLRGSAYLTVARCAPVTEPFAVYAAAFCCPRDQPSRQRGRQIALGRLSKNLEAMGWRIEER